VREKIHVEAFLSCYFPLVFLPSSIHNNTHSIRKVIESDTDILFQLLYLTNLGLEQWP